MRSSHLVFLSALLFLPDLASAKAWQGVTPGVSTQTDVIKRFGEPTTRGKLEGRSALVYKDEQAIAGTRQAQFISADGGVITEINVFPAAQLDREAVEGTYGKSAQKTFTDDFRTVWIFRSPGVMVFFGKDGFVEAIRFQALDAGSTRPGTARPTGSATSPAPPGDGQAPGAAP